MSLSSDEDEKDEDGLESNPKVMYAMWLLWIFVFLCYLYRFS